MISKYSPSPKLKIQTLNPGAKTTAIGSLLIRVYSTNAQTSKIRYWTLILIAVITTHLGFNRVFLGAKTQKTRIQNTGL